MGASKLDELAWDHLNYIDAGYLTLAKIAVKEQALQPVAAHFEGNLERLSAIHQFPIFISGMSAMAQAHYEQSCRERGLRFGESSEFLSEQARKEVLEEARDRIFENNLKEQCQIDKVYLQGELHMKIMSFDFRNVPEFQMGAQSMLQTMVINAWMSIEVMISQLGKAALKSRSAVLKPFKGDPWRIVEMVEKIRGTSPETRIPPKPGQLSFTSLQNARISYASLFAEDSESIDVVLASLSLDTLYLIRNQFAHEGGVVNEKFMMNAKGISDLEPFRRLGSTIDLDGHLAKRLLENALNSAWYLLYSVDLWLDTHKLKPQA